MNWALAHNVVLGPWIHVGSTVHNLAPAPLGKVLTARALVTGNYDRKGHRFVELDGLVLAGGVPVARIAHTADLSAMAGRGRLKALGGRPLPGRSREHIGFSLYVDIKPRLDVSNPKRRGATCA